MASYCELFCLTIIHIPTGQGPSGIVYQGKWRGTDVAIKVLRDGDDIDMWEFSSELSKMHKVRHPHVVDFIGASTKSRSKLVSPGM